MTLVPYAGKAVEPPPRRRRLPLWETIERGWKRGLTMREIQLNSTYSLGEIERAIRIYLQRRPA